MKRLFSILILTVAAAIATGIQARTFALLAAVSNYGDESSLAQTTNDVKAFREILSRQTKDITLLTSRNANAANIMEKLRAITNRAQKGDRIIFYFSGHGYQGGLVTYDMLLEYETLVEALSDTEASEVFMFIDACFAGTASGAYTGLRPRPGHVYMLSSRADETSIAGGWLNKSFFTQALLTGYRGKADTNSDRGVSVIELFKHIHKDVVRRSDDEQHPVLIAPRSMHDVLLIKYKNN